MMSDSSDEEHPFVKYGTALPEIDEKTVKPSNLKNSVPIFDQIVTDEQGRRRFHGAFTGGFSAGYYNTVSTKEGWTPTAFKSSRSDKSKRKMFTAQDFMDEEDVGDFGIAPKTLSTKEEFTSKRKRTAIEEKQIQFQEEKLTLSFGSDLVESLVVSVRSNVGIKLLRNMGWRDGQGLGPHVKRKKKKKKVKKSQNAVKMYGCSLPGVDGSDSDDENIPENFKFAPKDQMPISISYKDDHHGIGYSGLDPTAALHKKVKKSTAVKAKTKAGSKLSFFGQAFGVGAYEEEDDDIYAQDSISNYDAILGEERNPDDTYGWTKPLAITGGPEFEALTQGGVTKVTFVAAKKQSKLYPKVYPPPNIPQGFDPYRRLKLRKEKQRIEQMNLPQTNSTLIVPASKNASHLNSDDRRALLSDSNSPESTRKSQSVFDFISWEDRQKLEAAKRKPVELGFKGKTETREQPQEEQKVDRSVPLCKPSTLKPFSDNPGKLKRFEQYEKAVLDRRKDPYSTIISNLTEWERKHERDEFAKLSQVYLHLTSNINSRFTKASEDQEAQVEEGLQTTKSESDTKLKIFGVTTHSFDEWHPDPLLCKRFNVPNPYPDSDVIGSRQPSGSKYLTKLQLTFSEQERTQVPPKEEKKVPVNETGVVSDTVCPPLFEKAHPFLGGRWDKEPDFVGPQIKPTETDDEKKESENENEASTERPPMELFKSIFASSEEEESSSEEEEENIKDNRSTDEPIAAESTFEMSTVKNNRVSAADVFLNPLPFPIQEKDLQVEEPPPNNSATKNLETPPNGSSPVKDDVDFFGPAPPTLVSLRPAYVSSTESKDSGHKLHKHKKHKKHKKKDHKSKKKKKKA